jgi:plasmid stabilization system protein ParE
MILEIRFTPEAEETFDAVVSQLKAGWGDKFVQKFENKVSSSLKTIAVSPYLYPIIEANSNLRKCILHKNCSMLYKVYEREILIVCFWDNRQDPIFII